jgi:hypothetical protein
VKFQAHSLLALRSWLFAFPPKFFGQKVADCKRKANGEQRRARMQNAVSTDRGAEIPRTKLTALAGKRELAGPS